VPLQGNRYLCTKTLTVRRAVASSGFTWIHVNATAPPQGSVQTTTAGQTFRFIFCVVACGGGGGLTWTGQLAGAVAGEGCWVAVVAVGEQEEGEGSNR